MSPARRPRTARELLLIQGTPIVLVLLAAVLAASPPSGTAAASRTARPAGSSRSPAGPVASPLPIRSPVPPTPTPMPKPRRFERFTASGDLVAVSGTSAVVGRGAVRRYVVEVERGLDENRAEFVAWVEGTLAAPNGWAQTLGLAFQRVATGPVAFRVTLASPGTTDRLCRPLRTGGIYSCYMRGRAVLNVGRWYVPPSSYGSAVTAYRQYLINHEVGHALGFGHRECPGAGEPAPVMMQQSKGTGGCRPNPWPGAG